MIYNCSANSFGQNHNTKWPPTRKRLCLILSNFLIQRLCLENYTESTLKVFILFWTFLKFRTIKQGIVATFFTLNLNIFTNLFPKIFAIFQLHQRPSSLLPQRGQIVDVCVFDVCLFRLKRIRASFSRKSFHLLKKIYIKLHRSLLCFEGFCP